MVYKINKTNLMSLLITSLISCNLLSDQQLLTNDPIHEIKSIKEYDQVYSQPQACIINMYTDWCGACKIMTKDYSQAAKNYGNKVRFYKVNVGNKDLDSLIKKYKIEGIPTTLFVKNGKEERRERGTIYGQYLDDTVFRFAHGNDAADKRILARQQPKQAKPKQIQKNHKKTISTQKILNKK